jgi:hypothetical protein
MPRRRCIAHIAMNAGKHCGFTASSYYDAVASYAEGMLRPAPSLWPRTAELPHFTEALVRRPRTYFLDLNPASSRIKVCPQHEY